MRELSGLSKHLIQPFSLSGIKAPSPHTGFVLLGAEEGLKGELLQASGPSLPRNFERTKRFTRQRSQLQGANDQNHMRRGLDSVRKSEGFREGVALLGGTKSLELEVRNPRHPGLASWNAEHSQTKLCLLQEGCPTPRLLSGLSALQGSCRLPTPYPSPSPLLHSTWKLLLSLSLCRQRQRGLLRMTEHPLRKETCLACTRTLSGAGWNTARWAPGSVSDSGGLGKA